MSNRIWKLSVLLAVWASLLSYDAAAWGARSQKAIAGTTIQVIRRTYASAFKTEDVSYDEDVLRGANGDLNILNNGNPFVREEDAIIAVENGIRLLREVRKYGFGSYFSYRMGLLGALAADLVLPYSVDTTAQGQRIREQMEPDIDAALDRFSFTSEIPKIKYIRDAEIYFGERRAFFADSKRMIADDYLHGKGFDGYLKEGAQVFFTRAVTSVADVWNTVLHIEGEVGDVAPSEKMVISYLLSEIQYLLQEKKNFNQALKSYANFELVAKYAPEAYDKVGDLFYAFETEGAKERGVREWRIAYDMPSADRRTIGKKLSEHYVRAGEALLAAAQRPGASDQDLPNALNAFTQALDFDQTSNAAAQRINEANVAIKERKERRAINVNFIASAEKVKVQAEKARVKGDALRGTERVEEMANFLNLAIITYTQAIGVYEAIDDEFTDQSSVRKQSVTEIGKSITDIINQVLDAASDEIDKGDKAVTAHHYEDATASYERVPNIVSAIPGDETTTHGKEKKEIITKANDKITATEKAKRNYEEQQRQTKALAETGPAKGAPAAPTAPAAPALPAAKAAPAAKTGRN